VRRAACATCRLQTVPFSKPSLGTCQSGRCRLSYIRLVSLPTLPHGDAQWRNRSIRGLRAHGIWLKYDAFVSTDGLWPLNYQQPSRAAGSIDTRLGPDWTFGYAAGSEHVQVARW
jgi:hypothetical protein